MGTYHRPMIVFDWDDTLLASSHLNALGVNLDSIVLEPRIVLGLNQLEEAVKKVLERAFQLGAVCIITNSLEGWVKASAEKYFPSLLPLLENVYVYSARSRWEYQYPDKPIIWKYHAFREVMSTHPVPHVLSIGDSLVEREAIRAYNRTIGNGLIKSVKLAELPHLHQLVAQLSLLESEMSNLVWHGNSLDLMLTISYASQKVS